MDTQHHPTNIKIMISHLIVKKYEIIGLTESKDDVILTFERGNTKSLTYLGVTVDFDKENNAKCDKWECEIDIDKVQEYIIKFKLTLFK